MAVGGAVGDFAKTWCDSAKAMEAAAYFLGFVKTALEVFVVVGGVAVAAVAAVAAAAVVAADRFVVLPLSVAVGLPVNEVIRHIEVGASLLQGQFFFRTSGDMEFRGASKRMVCSPLWGGGCVPCDENEGTVGGKNTARGRVSLSVVVLVVGLVAGAAVAVMAAAAVAARGGSFRRADV